MTEDFDYDLFVIGGGSGGVRAARIAAEHGAKVGLAEEFRMGGTCVIRGCVPKKLMVFASAFRRGIDDAAAYGWNVSDSGFDWGAFHPRLREELDRLEGIYRRNLGRAGVEIHDARAVVADPHTVELSEGKRLRARHILIATGGEPYLPDNIRACGLAMTSNDIFLLEELPKKILIVGGGYIACEFACILRGMGLEVTQYYRGAQILRGFDDEVRGHLAELLKDGGIDLHVGCEVQTLEPRDGGVWVRATDGREAQFDRVLYATGRRPKTRGLGLEEAGVKLGRWGEVVVDEWSQTSVPSIYAVGDVTDRINLTPVAIREGHVLADTLFGGKKVRMDHDMVPGAVFTQPEYGYVGMTEEQARELGPIEVYTSSFKAMRGAFIGRDERSLFKLIVCAQPRRVLGCHIVSDEAGELIQMVAIAIKMGATKEDFDRTVAVHPTVAEELVTMRHPTRTS